ncbi:cold-shock protein [Cesiribacter andamanensis]|uniref:Cold shock-like protein CspG n=1 Tax=Cesiribacter andamanensis AMV16 TaxID=1279009 RepID=M7NB19_9BACT|nr:cold shock domain-containing protein [Cesiribacter andamanensis]EMR04386.1 Cold shock-like protein CspG [Cesiribacter andamanensis AMV16]
MGKSQETFSKKEKEKNRQKKKKEKELKKEERKANAGSSKSFDDMIAYVDENGNFSSTPPDPTQKKVIKQENISISTPKQEAPSPEDLIRTGIVTFFNESKSYGFIRDQQTQESIFVHANGLLEPIKENNKVSFEVEMGHKGPVAVNVKTVK